MAKAKSGLFDEVFSQVKVASCIRVLAEIGYPAKAGDLIEQTRQAAAERVRQSISSALPDSFVEWLASGIAAVKVSDTSNSLRDRWFALQPVDGDLFGRK